jgi:hypothetical protein
MELREAHSKLTGDGLSEELVKEVIGNTLCHALAFAAVHLDLPRTDLAEIFLQYCADVEASKSKARLDS